MTAPGTAASAAIPFKAADDTALPSGAHGGLATILCLVALAVMLWGLRRRGLVSTAWPRGRAALIDVLETRSRGAQTQLVGARDAGRRLWLSRGPAGTHCLRDDPDGEAQQA